MIKLFLNIHFIKKHPSKVFFFVSKCKNFKMPEWNFLRNTLNRNRIANIQSDTNFRILLKKWHFKKIRRQIRWNIWRIWKVRVKSPPRTSGSIFFSKSFLNQKHQILESTFRKAFQCKSSGLSPPSKLNWWVKIVQYLVPKIGQTKQTPGGAPL